MSMNHSELRNRLKKLAALIAEQAESDPKFAEQIEELLNISNRGSKSKVRPNKLGDEQSPKINMPIGSAQDPFEVFRSADYHGFLSWLESLPVDELREIVRQQRFDPSRLSDRWKKKARFIELISERVWARSRQGDTFRHYGTTSKAGSQQEENKPPSETSS